MNRKQRIAVIFLVISIVLLVTSLFVRAAIGRVGDGNEIIEGENETSSVAKVSLTVLPHGGVEDRRGEGYEEG